MIVSTVFIALQLLLALVSGQQSLHLLPTSFGYTPVTALRLDRCRPDNDIQCLEVATLLRITGTLTTQLPHSGFDSAHSTYSAISDVPTTTDPRTKIPVDNEAASSCTTSSRLASAWSEDATPVITTGDDSSIDSSTPGATLTSTETELSSTSESPTRLSVIPMETSVPIATTTYPPSLPSSTTNTPDLPDSPPSLSDILNSLPPAPTAWPTTTSLPALIAITRSYAAPYSMTTYIIVATIKDITCSLISPTESYSINIPHSMSTQSAPQELSPVIVCATTACVTWHCCLDCYTERWTVMGPRPLKSTDASTTEFVTSSVLTPMPTGLASGYATTNDISGIEAETQSVRRTALSNGAARISVVATPNVSKHVSEPTLAINRVSEETTTAAEQPTTLRTSHVHERWNVARS